MKLVRMLSVLSVLLAFVASPGHAETKAEPMNKMKTAKPMMVDPAVAATLEAQERKMNEAYKSKDVATFNSMVDPDGMMANPNGFSGVSNMGAVMNDFTVGNYTMDVIKIMPIGKDACVLMYTWKGDASWKGQPLPPVPNYCSTVWAKRGKEWKAVYHQETMAPSPSGSSAESH